MAHCGVVVLAAGASRRMGQPKQLLPFGNKPMLQHVIDQTLGQDFSTRVLVLGAYAGAIWKAISPGPFNVAINEQWEEGMAGSIRVGLEQSLALDPILEHLLIVVGDQPYVSSELIRKITETHLKEGKMITACRYQDTLGVPAMFSKGLFPELLLLRGDRGAGGLIRGYTDQLSVVAFDRGAVDVDTKEDYEGLSRL